ncbi:glycosyltransferase family 4 protein [Enterococcus sp. DIV0756]|uniref:glycosyltransferase family 4 protein n=1 Tax=Enterococcus sp. DIV0756 TaxID=2774636 RepID=UPI003F21D8B7
MKVAIVTNGILPIPAVNGGAVELLTNILIDENEKNENFCYEVFTVHNYDAVNESMKYKNSCFTWINNKNIFFNISKLLRHLVNKYSSLSIKNAFIKEVIKQMKRGTQDFDAIIVENKPEYGVFLRKEFPDKKIYLHLHNDFLNPDNKKAINMKNSYDGIFCISKWIKSRVNQIGGNNNTYLLYNGVDIQKFQKVDKSTKKEIRKKYGFEKDDFIVLYTGRIIPEKGVLELAKAIHNVRKKNPKIKLLLTAEKKDAKGKSSYLKEVHNTLDDDDAVFTGTLPYDEVIGVTASANIGVVPSVWDEPLALTSIEHMASKHPVIITNSGGLIETIDELSGLVVEKRDLEILISQLEEKILFLSRNPDIVTKMGNSAKNRSELFDKRLYVRNFVQIVKQVSEC